MIAEGRGGVLFDHPDLRPGTAPLPLRCAPGGDYGGAGSNATFVPVYALDSQYPAGSWPPGGVLPDSGNNMCNLTEEPLLQLGYSW